MEKDGEGAGIIGPIIMDGDGETTGDCTGDWYGD